MMQGLHPAAGGMHGLGVAIATLNEWPYACMQLYNNNYTQTSKL